jgi:ABC-2 type transport system permease protein
MNLVRAEVAKLRTTQVWFWMLVAAMVLSALVTIGTLAPSDGVRSTDDVPKVFANANGALLTAFILGILGVTTEFRYQTITPTVLGTPSRWAIVGAKLITYALVGLAYSAACLAVQLAIALPWLSAKDVPFRFGDPDIRRAVLSLPLVFGLFAVVGIGIGALIRNQIVAITAGLIFLLVVQNIVAVIPGVKHSYPYTPAGAVTSILFPTDDATIGDAHLLSPAGGVLVLLGWAIVPAMLGAAYSMNRDIT